MCQKKLCEFTNCFPEIGFGPGVTVPTPTSIFFQTDNKLISLCRKVVNKTLRAPYYQKKYLNAIVESLNVGFRLIDYSASYGDGKVYSKAMRISNVSRNELFITNRVSNKAQFNNQVRQEFYTYLENMKLDYIDLLQFHWPVTNYFLDTWKQMEKLKDEGVVKHLGVANCNKHHFESILEICNYCPEVVQIEIHPLFTQKSLVNYYKSKNIIIEAYTPVARYDGRLVELPFLKSLEKKYHKSFAQIILRWHIQNGIIPIIRSMNPVHIRANFDIFDFNLTEEEIKAIDSLNINSRLRYDPDNCDFSIF